MKKTFHVFAIAIFNQKCYHKHIHIILFRFLQEDSYVRNFVLPKIQDRS